MNNDGPLAAYGVPGQVKDNGLVLDVTEDEYGTTYFELSHDCGVRLTGDMPSSGYCTLRICEYPWFVPNRSAIAALNRTISLVKYLNALDDKVPQ